MQLFYRSLTFILFFHLSYTISAQLPTKCFEIQSILVDACGSPEQENEQIRLLTGPNPINTSGITVNWATVSNSFFGWCQNANTALKVDSLNQTILRCGRILEPPAGVIPPYSQVVFFTSQNMNVAFNSFANLTDTIYAVFQCNTSGVGNFANYQAGGGTRTTTFTYTGGCNDIASYDRALLVRQNGTIGAQDGAAVLFDFAGNPSYYNNGCQAAIPVSTVFAGNDTAVCPATNVINLSGALQNVKSKRWTSSGTGTFSQADSATTTYTLSGTDTYPLSFYLKGYISCNDSIMDTLVVTKIPNTINAGTDAPVCAGGSIIVFASGGSGYSWTSAAPSTISNPASASPTLTPLVTTDYFLTGTYGPGCSGRDTIRITVNPNDTLVMNTVDTTICFGQSVQLLASNVPSATFAPATNLSCTSCLNPVASPLTTANYTVTSNGVCPDTKSISIKVDQPTPLAVPFSACGQVTYKGITYTSNATILDTLKNIRGCDSILLTVNLTVTPFNRDTVRVCIVNGQSYTAGGAAQTNTGFYNDTIVASVGCDTIRVTDLIVITTVVNNNILSDCQSVTFNGNTYTSSTVVRDTVFSSRGCPQTITNTTITIANIPVFGARAVCILSGQSFFAGGANQTTSGLYRDTIALQSGCDSITITALQVINTTTNNNTLSGCNQVTFKGQTYTNSTLVRDTVKSALGCDSVYTNTTITVYTNSTTRNVSVCILNGQSYFAGGANQTASGVYRDTALLGTGCDSIIITNLQVINTITNTQTFSGCGQYTYQGKQYLSTTTLRDTTRSVRGCDSIYDNVQININPIPATVNQTACINTGQTFFVGTIPHTTSGIFTDVLTAANGCDSTVVTNLQVITPTNTSNTVEGCDNVSYKGITYTSNTTLTETIPSRLGCDSINNKVTIKVHPTTSYKITADKPMPIDAGETVVLSSNYGGTSPYYVWSPNLYISSGNNQPSITVNPTSEVVYTMDYYVADSLCKLRDTFRITIRQAVPKFKLPTAFSPNNDGVNDIFRAILEPGLEVDAFRIYNRWGELIFEEKVGSTGWDGTYKDVAQPVGVYVYYITVKNTNTGKIANQAGNVTLIR